MDPVNAASFGKLIRSVFMGLRTRRLGTRWVEGTVQHPPCPPTLPPSLHGNRAFEEHGVSSSCLHIPTDVALGERGAAPSWQQHCLARARAWAVLPFPPGDETQGFTSAPSLCLKFFIVTGF